MEKIKNNYLYIVLAVVIIVAAIAAYLLLAKPALDNRTVMVPTMETVSSPNVALSFAYESGVDKFTLIEPPLEEGPLKEAFIIMDTQAFIASESDPASVTPPTMSVFVFAKPEALPGAPDMSRLDELRAWAQENQSLTAITAASSEPEVVEIDGLNALRYSADGSYKQDFYLVSYQSNHYLFAGQYEEAGDRMNEAFATLMSTVEFD